MFKSEFELQQTFFKQLEKNKNANSNILQEFNARFGNVDIVEVNISSNINLLQQEQSNLLSIYSNALVVGYLHKNTARTFNYLKHKTGYTEDYLYYILLNLKRTGIISCIQSNKYVICSDFKFPNLKFNSYELKLKDWKKAIIQATRNTAFSYKSFVVMPNEEAIKLNKKHANIFNLYNIGLIGITEKTYYKYISPKVNKQKYEVNPIFISSMAKYMSKKELLVT